MEANTTKVCPFCAETIQAAAIVCRYCGRDVPPAAPVAAPTPAPAAQKKKDLPTPLIFLIVIAVVVGGWFLNQALGTAGSGGNASFQPDRVSAWVDCKDFVTKNLKAPSSAVFPASNESGVTVRQLTTGHWVVVGYVDAENSFGAPLRQTFGCELSYSGTNVTAEHLQIGEQIIR